MVIFSCKNLSKTFHDQPLFTGVSFGMESGDRVGIIGRNGVGKTTLLRILAGLEDPDSGEVAFNSAARYEYLEQMPAFDREETVLHNVMRSRPELQALLDRHGELCGQLDDTTASHHELDEVTRNIEHAGGWQLEAEAKKVLQRLGVTQFDANVRRLSGGQRKRVALAKALLSDPDLLILDEPTNHLDADSVQWLQDKLQNGQTALLLITHDRYFLDAVANRIVELDQQQLISYPGTYEEFLERKEGAVQAQEAEADHMRNRLRTELAWLQRGAKARRTKAKSRIDWIAKMEAAPKPESEKKIKIEVGGSFLGSRVIDAVNISKSIGGKLLFSDFTYNAAKGDRIGIIGANGCGKSTLLRVLAEETQPDSGTVKTGESVKLGFFRQENLDFDPEATVLSVLKDIAEYIDTGVGRHRYLSAADMLLKFHFPRKQHLAKIRTLSGGERRRLALLILLMGAPNVLFLDEPTNDFDIATLSALEEYLDNFFGFLVIVSHDRAFLDRTVNFIYSFEDDGLIKQYPGNYSAYLEKKEEQAARREDQPATERETPVKRTRNKSRRKLSWKEEKEYAKLEKSIAAMEQEKADIEMKMSAGDRSHDGLTVLGNRFTEVETEIEEAMLRWMELGEKME